MNAVFDRFQLILSESLVSAGERIWTLLPEILFAIVVIFAGWLIAVIVHHIVLWVLNFFAIDKLAAKTPLQSMLKSIGIHKSVSDILGWLIFWMLILLTLIVAADTLHLEQVSSGLSVVTNYIPQVIASLLIIIFGMLLAKFLQMLATQTLNKMDIGYKKFVGKAVQLVVLIFVFVAAVDQLGFNLSYILNGILTVASVALLMLGLGAAFGARTVLDNAIACQQLKRQLPVGSHIEIGSDNGEVVEYTLTNVVLKTASGTKVLPAVHFLTHTYSVS
ncbi:MAG: mechanosensitive ion channel family protein [Candidatus Peregrinibacteria bacterium]|nr:mechanosensitive ion channel family protein [Candidatus Peregrinibacteria bacterium]MCB9807909.1 mechanosensitive ion channel family protein [Candidatus Peribacteria bacterium]